LRRINRSYLITVELETRAEQVAEGWKDEDGFVTVFRQGGGPRANPKGDFPTGPEVGSPMPDMHCLDSFDNPFDLHKDRAGRPAIFILQRSVVW
jgi:hypothetical protein